MRWSQRTDVGLVRLNNEDSLLVVPGLALLAVADGMGGHQAGEVASRVALEVVADEMSKSSPARSPGEALRQAIQQANQCILAMAEENNKLKGMGTTITACLLVGRWLWVAQVGDSRAYLLTGKQMVQITEDHSLVQELYRQGGITRAEIATHPRRNVLTRALGHQSVVEVDIFSREIALNDRIILTTDGLTGLLDDHEIAQLSARHDIEAAVDELVQEALNRGGHDNITVILAVVD